jgi:hypothetical protein
MNSMLYVIKLGGKPNKSDRHGIKLKTYVIKLGLPPLISLIVMV